MWEKGIWSGIQLILAILFCFVVLLFIVITEAHMFWWLYKSPYRVEDPSKPWPIVLWLQGGPVSVIELVCGGINKNMNKQPTI